MSVLALNAINIRHGQIEDGPYWAKIGTVTEEVEERNGFQGQQFIEFPIDSQVSKKLAHQIQGLLPASLEFTTGIKVQAGKPTMVITGLKATQ